MPISKVVRKHRVIDSSRYFRNREQRLDFRRESKELRVRIVVKRLYTDSIPCGKQRSCACVPDGECKHPAQSIDALFPVFFPCTQYRFGIRICPEFVSGADQLRSQLPVVINLSIEDKPCRSI